MADKEKPDQPASSSKVDPKIPVPKSKPDKVHNPAEYSDISDPDESRNNKNKTSDKSSNKVSSKKKSPPAKRSRSSSTSSYESGDSRSPSRSRRSSRHRY